jgi:hypothetical protein
MATAGLAGAGPAVMRHTQKGVGVPDALDAKVGRRNDVVEGVAGEGGQLHALARSSRSLARRAGRCRR